jgi:hypothetical protein
MPMNLQQQQHTKNMTVHNRRTSSQWQQTLPDVKLLDESRYETIVFDDSTTNAECQHQQQTLPALSESSSPFGDHCCRCDLIGFNETWCEHSLDTYCSKVQRSCNYSCIPARSLHSNSDQNITIASSNHHVTKAAYLVRVKPSYDCCCCVPSQPQTRCFTRDTNVCLLNTQDKPQAQHIQ